MLEISRLQKKRAENIIWNAAKRYDFTPDFKAFDSDGNAELYWNCIIGAARRHYEYEKLASVFRAFDQYEDAATYEGLLWLGLENALYEKEAPSRPALYGLRISYAEALVSALGIVDDSRFYDAMALAHFSRVLGRKPKLGKYDLKLLDELEFTPENTTDEIVEKANILFQRWFQISTEERKKKKLLHATLFGRKEGKEKRDRKLKKFGFGFVEHPDSAYGGSETDGKKEDEKYHTKLTAGELRLFMEGKYGKQMFTDSELKKIEQSICVANHSGCKLLFTKGEKAPGTIQNGFEALQKQKEAILKENNRRSFYRDYPRNMTEISALSGKIQNSILLHLQACNCFSNSGRLDGGRVWRAISLDDDRVFIKAENGDMGELSVDILLDASTSQRDRLQAVSSQGYMIAESLSRCGIPCRVMSFCSMTGYTILRVFRDYNEPKENKKIFDYVANGCNRDGLAIKAAHYLMNESSFEHKLLIVLSDVKPNDVTKIKPRGAGEAQAYESSAGIIDTAYEVRRARADGIAVVCVFTGSDEDVPSAKLVYGRDFARIQSMDKFADTVGLLIQNQINIL